MRNLTLGLLITALCPAMTAVPAAQAAPPVSGSAPPLSPGEQALLRAAPAPGLPQGYDWHLPRGFPTPAVPADNPMSQAKVALGRRLFFDPRLSLTGRYSCASCHEPARAYSDGRKLALGATGEVLTRNAMALVNVAYNLSFGWQHPEVRSLEQQMRQPLFNQHPVELGLAGREQRVIQALAADPKYPRQFQRAFAASPDCESVAAPAGALCMTNVIKAIAAFERTLIDGDSPFDHYVFGGDSQALDASAKRGMALFFSGRLGCSSCHSGFSFAGNWRDAQGATGPSSFADDGTGAVVRVPTLRNIERTAPYMHDGRYATLDEVLSHYERVGAQPPAAGSRDKRLQRFVLSCSERLDLKAFLANLSDALPRAHGLAGGRRPRAPAGGAAAAAGSAADAAAPSPGRPAGCDRPDG